MAIVSGRIPLLNGNNFSTWIPQMEAILHKNRLLRMVRGEEVRPAAASIDEDATQQKRKFMKKI